MACARHTRHAALLRGLRHETQGRSSSKRLDRLAEGKAGALALPCWWHVRSRRALPKGGHHVFRRDHEGAPSVAACNRPRSVPSSLQLTHTSAPCKTNTASTARALQHLPPGVHLLVMARQWQPLGSLQTVVWPCDAASSCSQSHAGDAAERNMARPRRWRVAAMKAA